MSPLPLLAQAQQNDPFDDGVVVFVIAGVCFFYLVFFLIGIFFLLMLSKALARCRPHNRTMEPGMVWLNLVPLVNLVWMFLTAVRVSESLKNEFRSRGWHRRPEDYGQTLGLVACSLLAGSGMLGACGLPLVIAGLVCWVMYWKKVAGFSGQIASRADGDDYEEDYEDGRDDPRPPRRDDRDDRDSDDHRDDDRGPWDRPRR